MTRTVRLYLRDGTADATHDAQRVVVDRLHALADSDAVDELIVTAWPHRVRAHDSHAESTLAALSAFNEWAHDNDVSLHPAFDSHRCHSSLTDQRYRTTVLPIVCMAIYEDGDLVAVYPYSEDGRQKTVLDGVRTIESTTRTRGRHTRPPTGGH